MDSSFREIMIPGFRETSASATSILDFNEDLIDLRLPKDGLLHVLVFLPERQIGMHCMTSFKREHELKLSFTAPPRVLKRHQFLTFRRHAHRKNASKGAAAFDKMLDGNAERIYYVNLLTDAGTVLGFNSLHAIVLNPHYPNDLIPLDAYENCNYTSKEDEEYFKR
jgi:hypothetical protein